MNNYNVIQEGGAIDKAQKRHERIIGLKMLIGESFLDLAEELYLFSSERGWELLNYASFEAYLADPDVSIKRSTAFSLMGIYKTFILECPVQQVGLLMAGVSKLDVVRPLVTRENVLELVSMASALSRGDLRKALYEQGYTDKEPFIYDKCERCVHEFEPIKEVKFER
jgi:hypothetical protein